MPINSHELPTDSHELAEIGRSIRKVFHFLNEDEGKGLTPRIKSKLSELGLTSMDDLYEYGGEFEWTIHQRLRKPPTPQFFPTLEEFSQRLFKVIKEPVKPHPSPPTISASQVAEHAWSNWDLLKGRVGKSLIQYTYDLGKLMDELIYPEAFKGE